MKTLKKTIFLLSARELKFGLVVIAMIVGMALLEAVGVASIMPFLAILGTPEMLFTNPILNKLYKYSGEMGVTTSDGFFIALGIGAFALIIISAVYRTYTQHTMNQYIEMLRHSIGARLLETYLHQPYAFFLDRHSDEMSKNILSDVDQLIGNVIRPVFNMVAHGIVSIAIISLLLAINPWLVILSAGILGGLYSVVYLVIKNKLVNLGEILFSANKERYVAAGEAFSGIKDIKLLGRELIYLKRFEGPSHRYAVANSNNITLTQIPKYIIEAFAFGGIVGIVIILMINTGGVSTGKVGEILPVVGLYAFTAYRLQPALQAIFQGMAGIRYGKTMINNIYSDMRLQNGQHLLKESKSKPLAIKEGISFDKVNYIYPNSSRAALTDITFDIKVGNSIGIIGTTGAGKTTLVDILLGLLRPTSGAVIVDGIEITDEKLRDWQQSLGYVPQEIFLTDTSIEQNIAFGIPKDKINPTQVQKSAQMAQLHEFIMHELPEKYQTIVGERGVRLSGGQRQRIGIARALYKNPEILVFDEATSALDTSTEEAVMESINALQHQKTIFIIAHRLSTVSKCDLIFSLNNGNLKISNKLYEPEINFSK